MPRWYMEEKGIDYKLVELDLKAQQHREPEFLSINPFGKLPALVDDSLQGPDGNPLKLFESGAILLHLAAHHSNDIQTDAERALTSQWLLFANATLAIALFVPSNREREFPRLMEELNHQLHPERPLVGEQWGAADCAVQAYLASTAFADHCLGLVLDALDASPHRDNTIVVLFADHGFHLGEKQRWAKRTIWEDGTRVPLIIVAPGFEKGRRINKPAQLLDIFPTLLDLADLAADESQEGHSLVPLMKDRQTEWPHLALSSFGKGNYAVRSEHFRFIHYLDGSEEFYDHRKDPHEWNNLAASKELADVIKAHRRHIPSQEADVLPGNSTGHQAYEAANELIAQ